MGEPVKKLNKGETGGKKKLVAAKDLQRGGGAKYKMVMGLVKISAQLGKGSQKPRGKKKRAVVTVPGGKRRESKPVTYWLGGAWRGPLAKRAKPAGEITPPGLAGEQEGSRDF